VSTSLMVPAWVFRSALRSLSRKAQAARIDHEHPVSLSCVDVRCAAQPLAVLVRKEKRVAPFVMSPRSSRLLGATLVIYSYARNILLLTPPYFLSLRTLLASVGHIYGKVGRFECGERTFLEYVFALNDLLTSKMARLAVLKLALYPLISLSCLQP